MYPYRGLGEGYYPEGENGYLERVNVSVTDHKKPDTLNRYLNGRIRRDFRANAPYQCGG